MGEPITIDVSGERIPSKVNTQQLVQELSIALGVPIEDVQLSTRGSGKEMTSVDGQAAEIDIEPMLAITVPSGSDQTTVASVLSQHRPEFDDKQASENRQADDFEQRLLASPTIKKLLKGR